MIWTATNVSQCAYVEVMVPFQQRDVRYKTRERTLYYKANTYIFAFLK